MISCEGIQSDIIYTVISFNWWSDLFDEKDANMLLICKERMTYNLWGGIPGQNPTSTTRSGILVYLGTRNSNELQGSWIFGLM